MAEPSERRQAPRVRVEESLRGSVALNLGSQVLDISATGMRVQLPFRPSVGSWLGFVLTLGDRSLPVSAVVRNVSLLADVGMALFCAVGLEFEGLDADGEAFLERFVRSRTRASSA